MFNYRKNIKKTLYIAVLSLCMTSCGSDDDSDDTSSNTDCGGVEVINLETVEETDFVFTIKNGDTDVTGFSADIKYLKDDIVIGSGIGISAKDIDGGQTVEFTTVTTDVETAADFDCIEYTIQVFKDTSICDFEGTNCN